jgi:uncharacterized SAM-binding protein YcdF (DUF218 family)
VLGGGTSPAGIPGTETLERLIVASHWLKQNKSGQTGKILVVLSGGPTVQNAKEPVTESDSMATMLVRLLQDSPASLSQVEIIKEAESLNTHDNALFTRRLIKNGVDRIVLVTSQVHMPRAAAVFSRAGFDPCKVIAQETQSPSSLLTEAGWFNFATARRTSATLNEYAGLIAYRLKGWL